MRTYHGIPISESYLFVHNMVFTALLLVAIGVAIVLLVCSTYKNGQEEKARIKKEKRMVENLSKKAADDPMAQKQLKKLKKRQENQKQRTKQDMICNLLIWGLSLLVTVFLLVADVLPGWTDYIVKDYAIYQGSLEVTITQKKDRITLEDGTVLYGNGDLDKDDTYGTIVYSKRSKLVLGTK